MSLRFLYQVFIFEGWMWRWMIGNDVWLTNFQSLAGATLGSLTCNTNTHKYQIPEILDLLGSFTQQISDQKNPWMWFGFYWKSFWLQCKYSCLKEALYVEMKTGKNFPDSDIWSGNVLGNSTATWMQEKHKCLWRIINKQIKRKF